MNEAVAIFRCQRGLCLIWFSFFVANLVLLVVLSLMGRFGGATHDIWSWFWPNVLPMLLLIVGAFAAGAQRPQPNVTVHPFVYNMSKWLSVVYLALLFVTVLLLNAQLGNMAPIDKAKLSTYWLAPLQSLASIALGIFFGSPKAQAG